VKPLSTIAVLLGFLVAAPAQQSSDAGAIRSIEIGGFNIVVRGVNLAKVEIWAIPTGTEVDPQQYQLLGRAEHTGDTKRIQFWTFPIPPPPTETSGLLAVQIFAKGYDKNGKVIGQKSLPAYGATSLYDALWSQNEATKQFVAALFGPPSATRSFTSPDGEFKVEYPDSLVKCKRDLHGTWKQGSCEAYTPVCSAASCSSEGTVLCVAYPANRIEPGTGFESAAFSVNEVKEADSKSKCLRLPEPPPQFEPSHLETVNQTQFTVTHVDGVGMGHGLEGYVYRAFHQHKCYELDIRMAFDNGTSHDPGTLKEFNVEGVHQSLKRVLDSFTFLK